MPVVGGNTIEHVALIAGLGITFEAHNLPSRLNASGVVIPFGKGVVTDTTVTTENAARLPAVADLYAAFNGVAFYELTSATPDGATFGAVNDRSFTVMSMGEIAVFTREAVVKDNPVYLISENLVTTTQVGDFNTTGIVGDVTAAILIPNAKFTSSGAAGDLVKIAFTIGG